MRKILFVLLLIVPVFAYCDVYKFVSSHMQYGESINNGERLKMSPWTEYKHYITLDLTDDYLTIRNKDDCITLKILEMETGQGKKYEDGIYRNCFSFTVMDKGYNKFLIDVFISDKSDIAYMVIYDPEGVLVYYMIKTL